MAAVVGLEVLTPLLVAAVAAVAVRGRALHLLLDRAVLAVRLLLLAALETAEMKWAVVVTLTEVALLVAAAAALTEVQVRLALTVVARSSLPLVAAVGAA